MSEEELISSNLGQVHTLLRNKYGKVYYTKYYAKKSKSSTLPSAKPVKATDTF